MKQYPNHNQQEKTPQSAEIAAMAQGMRALAKAGLTIEEAKRNLEINGERIREIGHFTALFSLQTDILRPLFPSSSTKNIFHNTQKEIFHRIAIFKK